MNPKKRILLVNDDVTILKLLKSKLGSQDQWHIEVVESARQALASMQENPCDAVVSDIEMPEMTGIELLNRIKSQYPNMVRILHSAQTDDKVALESIECSHQYLRKPWGIKELKTILEAAFIFQNLVSNAKVRELVTKLGSLPSPPSTLIQVMEEIEAEEPNFERIAAIISADISMTANILKLANSAYFGLWVKVSDIAQAVKFLGLDNIRNLTLAHGVFSKFAAVQVEALNVNTLQAHSTSVAGFARAIAKAEFQDDAMASDAMVAGILHDVGKLILAMRLPNDYLMVIEEAHKSKESLWLKEQKHLGTTHAEVGAYLLGIWGLPTSIVEAVAFHHKPEKSMGCGFRPLTAVFAANAIWHDLYGGGQSPEDTQAYMQSLGMGERLDFWKEQCVKLEDSVQTKGNRKVEIGFKKKDFYPFP